MASGRGQSFWAIIFFQLSLRIGGKFFYKGFYLGCECNIAHASCCTAAHKLWRLIVDAFICDAIRTPVGRYGGGLAQVRPDDLAAHVIKALMERNPSLDPAAIDDVILGCANQAGEDNRNVARMAGLLAGLPETVSGSTVNRLCGSGLDALGLAARSIRSGDTDLMIAGGVESMSRAPFVMGKAETAYSRAAEMHDTTLGWRFVNRIMKSQYGVDSMPETGENVAEDFNISREDQDAFAHRSQQRCGAAMKSGRFAKEIVPVSIPQRRGDPKIVDQDEHPRPDTTLEVLAKLGTPFREGGTVTAGNASGVNDGAAALIVASEDAAKKHGLTPRARIVAMAAAGVPPRIMGIGPAPATEKLLARTGLGIKDIDIIELNEAFASQGLAVMRQLGLADDAEHVNPNGGAIALGHPLGMSGARIALTATQELHERGVNRAICTMCIGVGQGIALLLERV
jgi:acetyl-CoA acyltransferase